MKNKGFTLIELMIGMTIMSIIVALTFPAFTDLLSFTKGETASEEAQIDKLISLELIRLDLENAAYGIARDEANPPILLTGETANDRILQLNSTLNNTKPSTVGWMIYDCPDNQEELEKKRKIDKRQDDKNTKIVLLDHNKKNPRQASTKDKCPDKGIFIAFPYDGEASKKANACTEKSQFCTSVSYRLSENNTLSTCAAGTKNLLRAVGDGKGDPVMNCVADFAVTFALDIDEDGDIDENDSTSATTLPDTTAKILRQVKNINMYILMQEGQRCKDKDLDTRTTWDIGNGKNLSTNKVIDGGNYRWKVVRISGKPMSM